jgi:polyisoprenoid-binding protein YceI
MATWNIDPDHTAATFSIRYLMISYVRGLFNRVRGTITFDPNEPERSFVEVTIDASGVYTGIKKRDDHLRSSDFFEVEKYPSIAFRSTGVRKRGGNGLTVTGDLTIRGVTRQVTLEAEFAGPVTSPFGNDRTMGFFATTKLNQEDFGIFWNEAMEGGRILANEVTITLDAQADLAEGEGP